MGPGEITAIAIGSGGLGSVITGLIQSKLMAKNDARADWARFTGEMRQQMDADRKQAHEQLQRLDAMRRRLDEADARYRASSDHIDVLEAHIWAGNPPPPPARPEGI